MQLHTDATSADQPQNSGLTNIDIPAKYRYSVKGGQDLRDDRVIDYLGASCTRGRHRFDLQLISLFNGLVQQLCDKSDGA